MAGGTPNVLENTVLEKLLSACQNHLASDYEFTIECNPDSVNLEQANLMAKYGVNRISLGVQTTNDKILKLLNRNHDLKDAANAIICFRQANINNISVDFMYNLPLLKNEDIENAITFVIQNKVSHCSFYSLELKDGSVLTRKGKYKINSFIEEEQMFLIIERFMKTPFKRYEVSNWSMPGFESKHNLAYWLTNDWQGIGYGAHGFEKNNSYYIDGSIGAWERKERLLDKKEVNFQILMMGLRLEKGLDLNVERYLDAYKMYSNKLRNCSVVNNRLICNDINTLNSSLELLLD